MEQFNPVLEPARVFLAQMGAFLPKLILAVIILISGWMLAKFLKLALMKGLRAVNFHVLSEKAGIDGFLRQGGVKADMVSILGLLVFWFVLLLALVIAFNGLGLTYITDLVSRVVLFIPDVIIAVLVLAAGLYFARFVGRTASAFSASAGLKDADLLGRVAQYAIVVFVVLIALDQVNVVTDIIRQTFLILVGGVVLALALAFGLGGQKTAANLLERWWPRKEIPRNEGSR